MGFALIPIGHRRHIVGEGLIPTVGPPTESLYRHVNIALEAYRIHNVPAVKAP